MADVTFTAANVAAGTGAATVEGTAGATLTQGLAVYLDRTANTYKIAHCETSSATAAAEGFVLNAASAGQPVVVQTGGNMTCDGLTANTIYVLSASGKPCPAADYAAATDYLTILGVALTTTSLKIGLVVSGSGKTG